MMIELFYRTDCPYSKRVRQFISGRGLESAVLQRDVGADPEAAAELEWLTGRVQVPCLVAEGEDPLLESSAIIDWLAQNLRGRRSEPDPDPVEASPQY